MNSQRVSLYQAPGDMCQETIDNGSKANNRKRKGAMALPEIGLALLIMGIVAASAFKIYNGFVTGAKGEEVGAIVNQWISNLKVYGTRDTSGFNVPTIIAYGKPDLEYLDTEDATTATAITLPGEISVAASGVKIPTTAAKANVLQMVFTNVDNAICTSMVETISNSAHNIGVVAAGGAATTDNILKRFTGDAATVSSTLDIEQLAISCNSDELVDVYVQSVPGHG